jgi:small conductance mechanosensitive channel
MQNSKFGNELVQLAFHIVPQILWALGIILLTRLAIGFVGGITRKTLRGIEPTLGKFIVQAVEVFTLLVGIIAALNAIGIQATSIVAVIGAAGLAIGLAWQNTLSHFAAGVMLISLRPFEVGDLIETSGIPGASGVTGVVDAIGIFSTTLHTADHVRITIPNSHLFNGTVKNMTTLGTRRVDIEVNIGDRAIGTTISQLLDVVKCHPLVLDDPYPTCLVISLSKDGTIISLRPWCAALAYEQARSQIQQVIKETLDHHIPTAAIVDNPIIENQSSTMA